MSAGLLFWIIMVVGILFGGYSNRSSLGPWALNNIVLWVLLALLGWKVFGPILHQ